MNTLLAPLRELGEYEEITRALMQSGGKASVSGCVDSQKLHMIFGTDKDYEVKLIVTYSDIKARELLEDCRLYCRESLFLSGKGFDFLSGGRTWQSVVKGTHRRAAQDFGREASHDRHDLCRADGTPAAAVRD